MRKYRNAFLLIITLIIGLATGRAFVIFNDLSSLFFTIESSSEKNTESKSNYLYNTNNDNVANHYETIEETINRLKRDVVVTGTITGIPGQESAMFQIEGMTDQVFNINTQLMDGFIIAEITKNNVTLKNQIGIESFRLQVHNRQGSLESEPNQSQDYIGTESIEVKKLERPPDPSSSMIFSPGIGQGDGGLDPSLHNFTDETSGDVFIESELNQNQDFIGVGGGRSQELEQLPVEKKGSDLDLSY